MTRTGLLIALAIAAGVGLVFAIFPQLDIEIARFMLGKSHPVNDAMPRWTEILREVARWTVALVAAPAVVAVIVKLLLPRRRMLITSRAAVLMIATLLVGSLLVGFGQIYALRAASNKLVLTRTALDGMAMVMFTSALIHMPLAELSAINLVSPLLITAGFTNSMNYDLFSGRMQTLPVFTYTEYANQGIPPEAYTDRAWASARGALEFELSKKAWLTGALSHSYSTHHDDLSAALGFHKARTDASGGLTYALRPDIAVYGSLGRTISSSDANSASLIASAGISFGLKHP